MSEQNSKQKKKQQGKIVHLSPRPSIVRIAPAVEEKSPTEIKDENLKRKVDNNPFIKQMRALADAIDNEVKIILKI